MHVSNIAVLIDKLGLLRLSERFLLAMMIVIILLSLGFAALPEQINIAQLKFGMYLFSSDTKWNAIGI
jgi:hypothetical protein